MLLESDGEAGHPFREPRHPFRIVPRVLSRKIPGLALSWLGPYPVHSGNFQLHGKGSRKGKSASKQFNHLAIS